MSSTSAVLPEGTPPTKRAKRVPGEEGLWVFFFGDLLTFGVLFVVYLQARISSPGQFAADQARLNQTFGAINTIVLLVSSLLVVLAFRAVRSGRQHHWAPRFLVGAWLCGAGFLAIKAVEYADKFQAGVTPMSSDFYMYYFVLTGLHAVHLLIGMVVLTVLITLSRKPVMSKMQYSIFEGGACFWHLVDLLWIVLFPLIFLVR